LPEITIPPNLDAILNRAWETASTVPGFLTEAEARFLAMAAALTPAAGEIVEIGSFKGKSTVMLGLLARNYALPPVVAIDPHNFNNTELHLHRDTPAATTFDEFTANLRAAGVTDFVEARRQYSLDAAKDWTRPIRLLWIDGDHSLEGARGDFESFLGHLQPGGIVAFHDALHEFEGPIRVFVEQVLRSDHFGAAGFVGSIAWAQYRPECGARFRDSRLRLDRIASRLIPSVSCGKPLRGLAKLRYKFNRSRMPRQLPAPTAFAKSLQAAGK
jgi:predicted O-methyltransferase YrrM